MNYNIFLNRACDSSLVDLSQLSAESNARLDFYAIGQRNSIQNEIVNMFNNQSILNDLRKVTNLFKTYSLQSIYTNDTSIITPLKLTSGTPQNYDYIPQAASVFICFIKDMLGNIMGIDLVYCPAAKPIRKPSTSGLSNTLTCYNPCNNIFETCNDLVLSFSGGINLNRNLSFTINFIGFSPRAG